MGYRIKNNSLKWIKKIFLTKPLVRLLFLLFCCQGVQARLWLRWAKVISTNFHKMVSACADRFGRCIKWLIYCTMYEYEKKFYFLHILLFSMASPKSIHPTSLLSPKFSHATLFFYDLPKIHIPYICLPHAPLHPILSICDGPTKQFSNYCMPHFM